MQHGDRAELGPRPLDRRANRPGSLASPDAAAVTPLAFGPRRRRRRSWLRATSATANPGAERSATAVNPWPEIPPPRLSQASLAPACRTAAGTAPGKCRQDCRDPRNRAAGGGAPTLAPLSRWRKTTRGRGTAGGGQGLPSVAWDRGLRGVSTIAPRGDRGASALRAVIDTPRTPEKDLPPSDRQQRVEACGSRFRGKANSGVRRRAAMNILAMLGRVVLVLIGLVLVVGVAASLDLVITGRVALDPLEASSILWDAWLLSWLAAMPWTRRTAAQQAPLDEFMHWLPTGFGMILFAFGSVATHFTPLWVLPAPADWGLVAVSAAGLAFTWWARRLAGLSLWSGVDGLARTITRGGPERPLSPRAPPHLHRRHRSPRSPRSDDGVGQHRQTSPDAASSSPSASGSRPASRNEYLKPRARREPPTPTTAAARRCSCRSGRRGGNSRQGFAAA